MKIGFTGAHAMNTPDLHYTAVLTPAACRVLRDRCERKGFSQAAAEWDKRANGVKAFGEYKGVL